MTFECQSVQINFFKETGDDVDTVNFNFIWLDSSTALRGAKWSARKFHAGIGVIWTTGICMLLFSMLWSTTFTVNISTQLVSSPIVHGLYDLLSDYLSWWMWPGTFISSYWHSWWRIYEELAAWEWHMFTHPHKSTHKQALHKNPQLCLRVTGIITSNLLLTFYMLRYGSSMCTRNTYLTHFRIIKVV